MVQRQAQGAPAERRVFFLARFVFQIRQGFVAADIERAKNDGLVASRVNDIAIKTLLTFALRQRGGY